MKSLIAAAFAVTVLAAPALTFAQENDAPVTRAQVRAELVQLEKAGYRPNLASEDYPNDLRAAEARVAEQNTAQASAYGSSTSGSSQADGRAATGVMPVYSGQ